MQRPCALVCAEKITGTGCNSCPEDFLLVFFFEAEAKLYDIEKGLSYLLYIGITPTQR